MRGGAAARPAGKRAVCLTQFFKLTPADEKSGVIERRSASSSDRSSYVLLGRATSGSFTRFGGLCLLLGLEIFAGLLVDHLHGQPHLAALVKAEQLDFHFIAFLDDIGGLL